MWSESLFEAKRDRTDIALLAFLSDYVARMIPFLFSGGAGCRIAWLQDSGPLLFSGGYNDTFGLQRPFGRCVDKIPNSFPY